ERNTRKLVRRMLSVRASSRWIARSYQLCNVFSDLGEIVIHHHIVSGEDQINGRGFGSQLVERLHPDNHICDQTTWNICYETLVDVRTVRCYDCSSFWCVHRYGLEPGRVPWGK